MTTTKMVSLGYGLASQYAVMRIEMLNQRGYIQHWVHNYYTSDGVCIHTHHPSPYNWVSHPEDE